MSEDEFDFISHNFEQTCPAAFRRLWKETDLSDVTLVSEDGTQIPVHKIILASCSLFFKDLLSRSPHPLPLICLTGIKTWTLRLVLEYIYLGRCKVTKGDLLPFLTAGRDLLVEGLIEPTVLGKEKESKEDLIGKEIESKEDIITSSEDNHAENITDASQTADIDENSRSRKIS